MFDQAIQASEAAREGMRLSSGRLIPALAGCIKCRTIEMIAAPTLGFCTGCGAELTVIRYEEVSVVETGTAHD
jgi:hypothetical protein